MLEASDVCMEADVATSLFEFQAVKTVHDLTTFAKVGGTR
uniref:Bm13444 n=1 Tax=Brugia malayi TaxID=6279 RepID=A0A1I9G1S5_BRUMA|nr:Bm13444 [Brugia malayi]